MSIYSKKLHIKKPNGVIQTANLYTDKSDVGNNYLTLKDNNNIIYSILDVNGDIDCKISKNNVNYKVKNANVIVPNYKVIMPRYYYGGFEENPFVVPNNVNVIYAIFNGYFSGGKSTPPIADFNDKLQVENYIKESFKTNCGFYVKVSPNKSYQTYNSERGNRLDDGYLHEWGFGNYQDYYDNGSTFDPDYYEVVNGTIVVVWSSEINSHATNLSAD